MILEDISLRAESHYFDDLERCVLRSGDVLQLEVKVSGGRVEWFKDGNKLPENDQIEIKDDGVYYG